jgi:hypothetical protein
LAGRVRNAGRGAGRLALRLADGLPRGLVAALAILVLAGMLYTVASRQPKESRGWAEFTMFRLGCAVDPKQRLNVAGCVRVGPRLYRISFTRSLTGSTVLAGRGTCCPGQVRASIIDDHTVAVAIPNAPKAPIRATVFVP